jgi:hypothetical protein
VDFVEEQGGDGDPIGAGAALALVDPLRAVGVDARDHGLGLADVDHLALGAKGVDAAAQARGDVGEALKSHERFLHRSRA